MSSRRERIIVELVRRLQLGVGCPVERSRRSMVDASEAPHIGVFAGGHVADYTDQGDIAYTMQVDLEGTVGALDDAGLEPAVDALYLAILAVMAPDYSLGGLCEEVRETALDLKVLAVAESDSPLANFVLSLEVRFRTLDGDPAS